MKFKYHFLLFFLIKAYSFCGQFTVLDSVAIKVEEPNVYASFNFIDISCADSLNCCAVGRYYNYDLWTRVSTDGGKSWITTLKDSFISKKDTYYLPSPPYFVYYPNVNFCFIGCDTGYYWLSVDTCKTWSKGKINTKSKMYLKKAVFKDNLIGAVIDDIELFVTIDGCQSWRKSKIPFADTNEMLFINDISYVLEDNILYVLTTYSPEYKDRLYFSSDFGDTWDYYEYEQDPKFSITFIDKNTAWSAGGKRDSIHYVSKWASIMKTTDGGRTWVKKLDTLKQPYCEPPFKIIFLDKLHGFAFSYFKLMWRTDDGGETWYFDEEYAKSKMRSFLYDIAKLNSTSYIGVTFNDWYIYKYDLSLTDVFLQQIESYEDSPIFPNPASDYITVTVGANGCSPESVKIFDVFGQEYLTPTLSTSGEGVRFDVSALPPGVYFVRVGSKVIKFIKY